MKKPKLTSVGGKTPADAETSAFYRKLEIDVLARTLWGEARGEGDQGMEAVACVILNRVSIAQERETYWWGNNLIQVCQKPYQFSCWNRADPNFQKLQAADETDLYFATALRIARRAIAGTLKDITNGATHYHAKTVQPYWIRGETPTAIISKPGLPVFITVLSGILKTIDSSAAKSAAESLDTVSDAMRSGGISLEQITEANRHAEKIAELQLTQFQSEMSEANETIRAEAASSDPYVRRMRPTFGYLMAITWAAQMLALAWVIVFQTDKAGFVLQAMGSLSAMWAFGLSVLGIYIYKRSEEKRFTPGDAIYWSGPRKE